MKKQLILIAGVVVACGSSTSSTNPTDNTGAGSSSTASPDGGSAQQPPSSQETTPDPQASDDAGAPAQVEQDPTSPNDDANHALGWAAAPIMSDVTVVPNRDSAIVVVPAVSGAVDYRVVTIPSGVSVAAQSGGEHIAGSTIYCAGYRQHNAPQSTRELMRQIEVTGLSGPTRVVVEAIDTACPYVGALGPSHVDVTTADNVEIDAPAQGTFSISTEAEVRQSYGSLVLNGHGNNPTSPGRAAADISPKVLARTTLKVTPLGTGAPPTKTFFDDFTNEDQPVLVGALPDGNGRTQLGKLYQNSKYSFYTYDASASQFSFARGQMHFALADWSQDVMSTNIAYPKKPVALSDTDYLHVTYEVGNDATSRRYWELLMCGSDTAGQTMGSDGKLMGNIIQTPFFMDDDGLNPSVEGWNCLQLFGRQGWPFTLGPDNTFPQSEIRVMVNKSGNLGRSSVVNVSPAQYTNANIGPPSWFRTQDGSGKLTGPILDDQQLIAPRTKFDVYVSRGRVVMYVNGEQRICNNLGTAGKLTMAEGALGFGQVLYHSAAERQEFNASYWDRRGQRYYIENSPFIDERDWDNVGYDEHVSLPSGFDASVCYTPNK
jgi:hypothetical protein